jgi:uncharacterized membrane protein YccF (DUF307 family)
MKVKRQAPRPQASGQSIVLLLVVGMLTVLSILLGNIYQVPSRFTLPISIVLLWICGAMALWHFGKRRS